MKNKFIFLFLLLLSIAQANNDFEPLNLDQFAKIIISDNGRQKPLTTFAKVKLLEFSSRSSFRHNGKKYPAIYWLSRVVFYPQIASEDEIFRINNRETLEAMKLDSLSEKRRYSFNELSQGLINLSNVAEAAEKIETKDRSAAEAEIVRLYTNLTNYISLSSVFQFAIPQPSLQIDDETLAQSINLPFEQKIAYFDLLKVSEKIGEVFEKTNKKKSEDWNNADQSLIKITKTMFEYANFYRNIPFGIIPILSDNQNIWLSPWDALNLITNRNIILKGVGHLK